MKWVMELVDCPLFSLFSFEHERSKQSLSGKPTLMLQIRHRFVLSCKVLRIKPHCDEGALAGLSTLPVTIICVQGYCQRARGTVAEIKLLG